MTLVTVSGPPSSGKTSIISKTAAHILSSGKKVGAVKFDCLQTDDDKTYKKLGIPVLKGLSKELCPDHFFITNIEDVNQWGERQGVDYLISESAGLCNRCSPHIKDVPAICVIDQLSGIHTPQKIGPMLRMADIVVITKSDLVSQAEREVFAMKVQYANPKACVYHVNGLTGQGSLELAKDIMGRSFEKALSGQKLRFPMPMAICSYCLGETRIGGEFQTGNVRKVDMGETG